MASEQFTASLVTYMFKLWKDMPTLVTLSVSKNSRNPGTSNACTARERPKGVRALRFAQVLADCARALRQGATESGTHHKPQVSSHPTRLSSASPMLPHTARVKSAFADHGQPLTRDPASRDLVIFQVETDNCQEHPAKTEQSLWYAA